MYLRTKTLESTRVYLKKVFNKNIRGCRTNYLVRQPLCQKSFFKRALVY